MPFVARRPSNAAFALDLEVAGEAVDENSERSLTRRRLPSTGRVPGAAGARGTARTSMTKQAPSTDLTNRANSTARHVHCRADFLNRVHKFDSCRGHRPRGRRFVSGFAAPSSIAGSTVRGPPSTSRLPGHSARFVANHSDSPARDLSVYGQEQEEGTRLPAVSGEYPLLPNDARAAGRSDASCGHRSQREASEVSPTDCFCGARAGDAWGSRASCRS
jgi:hypothetical protein